MFSLRPVTRTPRRNRWLGQSMVEFALVLPIMLILLAGAIDLGRLFYAYIAVENAAKEGALFGARQPLCDDAGSSGCADPNNVIWHAKNEAPNVGPQFTTTVACRTPAGALVTPMNDCLDGYTYQVTVTYPFQLLTPILGSIVNSNLTLRSESQATVISDAFDPSGLELLVWVNNTGADNGAAIASACGQADASSPNFYYQPCQDSSNVNNYLTFPENTTVSYKVRVRNTGNLALANVTYSWQVNGTAITAPGNCNTLPGTIAKGAAPAYCTFTRTVTAVNPVNGLADYIVAGTASGQAGGLSTGQTNGSAVIKVAPAPKLAVNLRAAPWRLGGSAGNGLNGVASYGNNNVILERNATSTVTEIKNPTGWLYLTVVNQGSQADNFNVSVTQNGTAVGIPCSKPATLAEAGQPGDTFICIFPRTFTTTGAFVMVATASATNAVILGGQHPTVTVTTQATCTATKPVIPNLVDSLNPADGSNKTVGQAKTTWTSAGFTSALTTTPAGAGNGLSSTAQSRAAYTCANNANVATSVTAQ